MAPRMAGKESAPGWSLSGRLSRLVYPPSDQTVAHYRVTCILTAGARPVDYSGYAIQPPPRKKYTAAQRKAYAEKKRKQQQDRQKDPVAETNGKNGKGKSNGKVNGKGNVNAEPNGDKKKFCHMCPDRTDHWTSDCPDLTPELRKRYEANRAARKASQAK